MSEKEHATSEQPPELESYLDEVISDLVDFNGLEDTYNPHNWSFNKKTMNTLLYGLTTLSSTWASAA